MKKLTDLQKELTALISLVLSLCPVLAGRFLRMKGLTDITVCYIDTLGRETFKVINSKQVNGIKDRIDMLYVLHMLLCNNKDKVYKIVLQYDQSRGNLTDTYYVEHLE